MRLAPAFQGQFYPGRPAELAEVVDDLLRPGRVQDAGTEDVVGALVPHAGYVYSGVTAGMALGRLKAAGPDAIVVLAPSHRVPIDGIHVFDVEGFETALGPIESDRALAAELAADLPGVALGPPFAEHALEVQLPFLRVVLPGAPVVAGAFGLPDLDLARRFAERLAEAGERRRLLVVASSDLSHYHDHEVATILDGRFRVLLESGDAELLWRSLRRKETEACGAGPVLTLMELARRRGARFEVTDQRDSSAAFGDESRVVGYLSALALVEGGQAEEHDGA